MFILYAIVTGLGIGILTGGRPDRLGSLHIRWAWVIALGLAAQVALFSAPVTEVIGALGAPLYVASTLVVLAAVLTNRAIPGMWLVIAGAISNLVAIVANGGYMPTTADALAALGKAAPTTYSNSSVPADPLLWPLTDIFAMPPWLPFANVFSVGDLLIGAGMVVLIVTTMHRARPAPGRTGESDRPPSTGEPLAGPSPGR